MTYAEAYEIWLKVEPFIDRPEIKALYDKYTEAVMKDPNSIAVRALDETKIKVGPEVESILLELKKTLKF